jgi:hypothetical protein
MSKKNVKETVNTNVNIFTIPVFGMEKVGKSAISLRYAKDQFKSLISKKFKKKFNFFSANHRREMFLKKFLI